MTVVAHAFVCASSLPAEPVRGRPSRDLREASLQRQAADPDIGAVILSQYADESYAFELFRNGTAGLAYLLKDRVGDLHHLVSALRQVAAGGSVIDPMVVEALVASAPRRPLSQ